MKKLFLASYFTEVAHLLPDFLGENPTNKKVAFIPTAALVEEEPFYVDTDREALQKLGLIVQDLEVSQLPYEIIEKSLAESDYIFVGGGSTFYLLQELKRKGVDKLLIEHIKNGKPYISTSAGSLLVQQEIIADDVDLPEKGPELNGDHRALRLIDFYLYVHYGHHYYGNDDDCISKYYQNLNLIRISDQQVVTVKGDLVEVR